MRAGKYVSLPEEEFHSTRVSLLFLLETFQTELLQGLALKSATWVTRSVDREVILAPLGDGESSFVCVKPAAMRSPIGCGRGAFPGRVRAPLAWGLLDLL